MDPRYPWKPWVQLFTGRNTPCHGLLPRGILEFLLAAMPVDAPKRQLVFRKISELSLCGSGYPCGFLLGRIGVPANLVVLPFIRNLQNIYSLAIIGIVRLGWLTSPIGPSQCRQSIEHISIVTFRNKPITSPLRTRPSHASLATKTQILR